MMDWRAGIKRGPFTPEQIQQFAEFSKELDSSQIQWLSGYFAGVDIHVQLGQGSSTIEQVLCSDNVENVSSASLLVLYGTQTGNSENLAKMMEEKAKHFSLEIMVKNMAIMKVKDFKKATHIAIIVSTQGEGEPPVEAEEFYSLLLSKKAPDLSGIKYSVLGLGDTSYTQFCQTGKDFDRIFEKLGAERLCPRVDCDVDYEDDALAWMESFLDKMKIESNSTKLSVESFTKKSSVKLDQYTRKNPFEAVLSEKIMLNGRGASKETFHLEFNIENSGIQYTPGDSLGVYAPNSKSLVEAVLNTTKFSGLEEVEVSNIKKNLHEALTFDFELTPLTTFSLVKYTELCGSTRLKKILDDKLKVMEYLYGRDILDLMKEFPYKVTPQELISILRKNTARMYSIASSQNAFENEVHLLVSKVRYESYGRSREGLCSSFLSDRLNIEDKAKVFVESNSRFRMPEESKTPIIMVGPGTGVAPFRAFIQQREMSDNRGKTWLFFGERNFTTDFLYQTEWQQYLKDGILTKADVAFSRDGRSKVYVQHKMLEKGKDLYDWLENGAHFYVCGDAKNMAKDVEKVLKEVAEIHGNKTKEQASDYIKYLQLSNRYQTDVY